MNRVHSGQEASVPVEGRSFVRDELQRLVDAVDHRLLAGATDRDPAQTTRGLAVLAARLALINAERLDGLSARLKDTDTYDCPICAGPINEGDLCLQDIDMGDCHAECLEGAPMVDFETGDLLPDDAPKPEPYPWRSE